MRDRRRIPGRFLRVAPLPQPVYREFIDMLFSMRLPVLGLGMVYAGVAGLAAYDWNDPVNGALAILALILTVARLLVIRGYWRAQPLGDDAQLRRWEGRYAIGNYAFAVLLGLLNMHAIALHLPLLQLLTVSLVFSFGAGVVARISIRPVICVVSLLLATVPTVAALAAHAFIPHAAPLHAELFAFEALLVAMITGLSLQTVAHLYYSAVLHHTAKHDLAQLARSDALTGLPNRLLLRERFRESSAAAARADARLAVHFIDLDGFKAINDGHGHPAGDSVLQQVARRLETIVRDDDTVARLGGDEFIVLQTDVSHAGEAEMLARRIIKRLSEAYEVDGQSMRISASAGIAMTPDYGFDLEQLLACADAALYRSKTAGKNRLNFCTLEDAENAKLAA